jgi:hypothetical protein
MFEDRGSPTKQDDLEEKSRQVLSEQEARKRIEHIPRRVTNGFYALDARLRFRAVEPQAAIRFDGLYPPLDSWLEVGTYLSKNGPPVYSLDIARRKQAGVKLREQAEAVETINLVGQVTSTESDIL